MQAIMLAAGMGKRLGRYTNNGTKCMVQVNGKALIEYAIESLVLAHISRMVIVVGYKSQTLKEYISTKFNESNLCGMKIDYIENKIYDKTNNIYSFYLARNELLKDDTILLESDVIYKPEMISNLINANDKNLAVVSKFESWMDGTCALLDSNNDIVGMVDKKAFNWSATENYYKTVNIYKFSKDFSENYYIPFLEAYQKAFGRNEYYEQVLKVLTFLGSNTLKAFVVPGDDWYEIDDPADLAIASDKFAKGMTKLKSFQHRFGGYWRFPKMLDFCYLVNPYFPPKQMVNEIKSSFDVLMSQYPSGAYQQSLLAAKLWNILPEQIVVGNGAAELISSLGKLMNGKCAIPYPTFNEYPERFANMTTVPVNSADNDFAYTSEDILRVVKNENCNCVLLINPDNPSGNFLCKDDVLKLLEELKKLNATLIFDESFIDFADSDIKYSLISSKILDDHDNLIVIKSISKSYGIPGFRLGVLASKNTDFVSKIKKQNAIWNINSFGEYFFQIFEKYSKSYLSSCDKIAEERSIFINKLNQFNEIKVYPSQANYILVKLPDSISSEDVTLALLENYNIFIKDLSSKKCFENGNYIRLAIRSREDNDRLISALKGILI